MCDGRARPCTVHLCRVLQVPLAHGVHGTCPAAPRSGSGSSGRGLWRALRRYEAAKKKGDYDEETQRREHAKNALERYMHYYQRWAENDRARLKAGSPTASCIFHTAANCMSI